MAVAALTPILVAQSVIEEREGRTLELMAITRLPPGRILWGKLLSRVLGLELLVLAGMPILAICMSLGGVELSQLANVWLQMTTLIVSAGAVAAFLGLYATGPFSPALLTWFWMFVAFTMGVAPHFAMSEASEQAAAFVSPFWSLIGGEGWTIVGPILTFAPVAFLTILLGAAGFRAMVAQSDDPVSGLGSLSKDFDGLRRMKNGLAILMVALLAATPLMLVQVAAKNAMPGFWPAGGLSWVWNIGWIWLGTGVYLLAARVSYIRLANRRSGRHRKSWRQQVAEWRPVSLPQAGEASLTIDAAEAAAWEGMLEEEGAPEGPGSQVPPAGTCPAGRPTPRSGPDGPASPRCGRSGATRWPGGRR